MPIKRKMFVRKQSRSLTTPAAIRHFGRLYEASSSEEYWDAHADLVDALVDHKPWVWPAVIPPDVVFSGSDLQRPFFDEARRNWDVLESAFLATRPKPAPRRATLTRKPSKRTNARAPAS